MIEHLAAMARRWTAPTLPLLALACSGPQLHLDNPEGHRVFVDGFAVRKEKLPFRYYGTTRWDALPASDDTEPDFPDLPASEQVEIPPPVTGWLFPFDLPLELMLRVVTGRRDRTVAVTVPPTPPELRVDFDAAPTELAARAQAARAAR